MERNIKGVLIDVKNNMAHCISINYDDSDNNYLNEYYKVLNCDLIDIVERKIGGNYYSVICDDEGLLKDENPASAFTFIGDKLVEILRGNLFICKHDNYSGETLSLTDSEITEVFEHVINLPHSHKIILTLEV